MANKVKVGKAAMFKNKSDNARAPVLRVLVDVDRDIPAGTKLEVSLWGARDDDGNPKTTKDGDKYHTGSVQAEIDEGDGDDGGGGHGGGGGFDDSLPFAAFGKDMEA